MASNGMDKSEQIKKQIEKIEELMSEPDFWTDKDKAQEVIQEYNELKEKVAESRLRECGVH